MKLFPKSFERRRLFKKRQHPETFVTFTSRLFFRPPSVKDGLPCDMRNVSRETSATPIRIPRGRSRNTAGARQSASSGNRR
ncbi:hypothetical protein C3920_13965 [Novacetimonas pomaceti]|uniref:Uncharacterized protein n=1 Tax=Novacetimonas pomaceti TaxID=2021998 RepID=A0ABX5P142_9PROT|nr:hypothetical protein C3920_13965 [Novacetimonas pomaceti]